jgi:signal recognition particle subunit SRP54
MFESLTEKILSTLRTISGKNKLSEEVINEVCEKLRVNLLEADVNVKVIKTFLENIKTKALGSEVQKSFTPEQHFIRIVFQELTSLMGDKKVEVNLSTRPPAVILMVGLQGSGKTTTTGKLSQYLKNTLKKSVMVASIDIYRPAAIEQLKVVAEQVGVTNFENPMTFSARDRAIKAKEEAIKKSMDVLIIDSAGRLHIDEDLMAEIQEVSSVVEPIETILVVDGMTGQDAVKITESFTEKLKPTGVILTKLDGDTKGGAALSIKGVTQCPIKFIGTGEKPSDFEVFHPDRMASRILDMGDLLSLAEKAQSTLDPEQTIKLAKKIKKNDFTLADFYMHLQQIKKMGSFENLMKFIPGMGQMSKQISHMAPPDKELKKIEAIILSMTPTERVDHNIIDGSRRKRIANGSGTKVEDINRLLKQFLEARKMMTRFTNSPMGKRKFL